MLHKAQNCYDSSIDNSIYCAIITCMKTGKDPAYVEALETKLSEIKGEISELQSKIKDLFGQIEQRQKQADNIVSLLEIEGVSCDEEQRVLLGQISVPDLAFNYLAGLAKQTPVHYREIAKQLLSQGTLIPGKDPDANLLAQISRDGRFVRVAPGTYGLVQWGISPALKKTKKKSRRR